MKTATLIKTAIVGYRTEEAEKVRLDYEEKRMIPITVAFLHPTVIYQPGKGWLIDGALVPLEAAQIVSDYTKQAVKLRRVNEKRRQALAERNDSGASELQFPF